MDENCMFWIIIIYIIHSVPMPEIIYFVPLVSMNVLSTIPGKGLPKVKGKCGSWYSWISFIVILYTFACSNNFLAMVCRLCDFPVMRVNRFQLKWSNNDIKELVTCEVGGKVLINVGYFVLSETSRSAHFWNKTIKYLII